MNGATPDSIEHKMFPNYISFRRVNSRRIFAEILSKFVRDFIYFPMKIILGF